jgi:hypothetical protein
MVTLVAAAGLGFAFLCLVFRPLEIVFPAKSGQRFFRPGWRTDLCFFLGHYLFWGGIMLWLHSHLRIWLAWNPDTGLPPETVSDCGRPPRS